MGKQGSLTTDERRGLVATLATLPAQLEALAAGLDEGQLTAAFLPGEWTVAQVVHHVADAHLNGYLRMKKAVVEDHPTLQPYDQDRWAALPDARDAGVAVSLQLLAALHQRWVRLLTTLPEDAWARTAYHPENGDMSLDDLLRTYAGHGELHLEQIRKTLAAAGR